MERMKVNEGEGRERERNGRRGKMQYAEEELIKG